MKEANALLHMAIQAKEASQTLRLLPPSFKREALLAIADEIETSRENILKANALDLSEEMPPLFRQRLSLAQQMDSIVADARKIAEMGDPIGEIIENRTLENGLHLKKKRIPLGVIGAIYESRPNVTVDIAVLALKSGNCVILRGGKEALRTNTILVECMHKALKKVGFPHEAVQLITNPGRSQLKQLVTLDSYIDLIIPRGGRELHHFCRNESTIPVITGGIGVCHLFVDESASQEKALEVIYNAKTQRPSVCNALDTLLVHRAIAEHFLPQVVTYLNKAKVTFKCDPRAWEILNSQPLQATLQQAQPEDWDTEWLALVLGIKVVDSLEEAIKHIQRHSTLHSDGILTNSTKNMELFVDAIDSSAVYINASTRFTDGGQFGMGAEVAISTQKLHARGPMGLHELTTYKWVVTGDYHTR